MESESVFDAKKENRRKWARILIGTAFAFILFDLWLLTPRALSFFYGTTSATETGAIGDTYGAFNGLVSGGAMVALVVSIWLQRADLKKQSEALELQREEMGLQRQEMAATAKAMQEQVEIARLTARLNAIPAIVETKVAFLSSVKELNHIKLSNYYYVVKNKGLVDRFFATVVDDLKGRIAKEEEDIETAIKTEDHGSISVSKVRKERLERVVAANESLYRLVCVDMQSIKDLCAEQLIIYQELSV